MGHASVPARALAGSDLDGMSRVLVLPVGTNRYAVPLDSVREVVRAPVVRQVPTSSRAVVGLFNLRGEIVPLLDIAVLLGLDMAPDQLFVVVLRTPFGLAGIGTSATPFPAVPGPPVGPSSAPGTRGAYAVAGEAVVLLDAEALFTPEALANA